MGWFFIQSNIGHFLFADVLDEVVPDPRRKVGPSGLTSARRGSRGDDVSRLPYSWLSSFPLPEPNVDARPRAESRMK